MATLLLRNLDDQIVAALKQAAVKQRSSVQQVVRDILRQAMLGAAEGQPLDLIVVNTGRSEPLRRDEIYPDGDGDRG